MEVLEHLSIKYCCCCGKRLDKTPRAGVSRVQSVNLSKVNTCKPIILSNKRKEFDGVEVKTGDLIVGHASHLLKDSNLIRGKILAIISIQIFQN